VIKERVVMLSYQPSEIYEAETLTAIMLKVKAIDTTLKIFLLFHRYLLTHNKSLEGKTPPILIEK